MEKTFRIYMFAVLTVFLVLTTIGIAHENKINISVKYLNFSHNTNTANMEIILSGYNAGKIIFIENYYSEDSNGNLKFYSSNRFENNNYNGNKLLFNIKRPNDRKGQSYSVVETIIINNNKKSSWKTDLKQFWK